MVAYRRALPLAQRPDQRISAPAAMPSRSSRLTRLAVNLAGAAGAAFFAIASFQFYLRTHSLIGAGFCVEQAWFVIAFLVRRPARAVTRRSTDWLLAVGGSFGGTGFRPAGLHPAWGVWSGLALQTAGLIIGLAALIALGRSFGMAPANRGLVTRGPYALVRHPIYSSYLLVQCGYLLQSLSWRNAAVFAFTAGCNIGRALAEERLLIASAAGEAPRPQASLAHAAQIAQTALTALSGHTPLTGNTPLTGLALTGQALTGQALTAAPALPGYPAYRATVRWRLAPGVW